MDIKEELLTIYHYFIRNRGVGHSQLAKSIAEQNNAIVIYPTRNDALDLVNGVGLDDLAKMQGVKKPAILDNYTVSVITEKALKKIESLETKIIQSGKLIHIHTITQDLETEIRLLKEKIIEKDKLIMEITKKASSEEIKLLENKIVKRDKLIDQINIAIIESQQHIVENES